MNVHAKSAIAILAIGLAGMLTFKYGWPLVQERLQRETSDARDTKARMVVGVDNWIGYFRVGSADMKKRMRTSGYLLQCEDDKADYAGPMCRLKNSALPFAGGAI